ncbi:MAG TPA: hypothetical protein DCM23_02835 [Firmicutes bacterium]|nr:hypothetical protein [Bacillota bacterium]
MEYESIEKHDYNDEIIKLKLPRNRIQSWFDCLINHTRDLVLSGLILTLFAFPLIALLGLTNIIVFNINYQLSIASITELEAAKQIFEAMNTSNVLAIPALVVLFVGLAGIIRVTRRLIWQEHVSFSFDFKQGIKQNGISLAITALALGIVNFVMQLLIRYGYFAPDSSLYDAALVISIALFALLILIAIHDIFQTDLYNLTFKHRVKNSFLLAMRTAPQTILAVILFIVPWISLFFSYNGIVYFIILAILFIIILPLQLLAIQEFIFSVFDRVINKEHHPEIFDKGIYRQCQK